mmetsp:Transcript_16018/g.36794  ORF Transcript_16018/g.36794 Transcript_16018/m.36794 type:complete len:125 (+) Transcript_16018:1027-1401(+)
MAVLIISNIDRMQEKNSKRSKRSVMTAAVSVVADHVIERIMSVLCDRDRLMIVDMGGLTTTGPSLCFLKLLFHRTLSKLLLYVASYWSAEVGAKGTRWWPFQNSVCINQGCCWLRKRRFPQGWD